MKYRLTRIIRKYGWEPEAKESRRFDINDAYAPMEWDDIVNNIGYLVEGHPDEEVTFKIKMIKEEE